MNIAIFRWCLLSVILTFVFGVTITSLSSSNGYSDELRKRDLRNRLIESGNRDDVFVANSGYFGLKDGDTSRFVRAGRVCVCKLGELGLETKMGKLPFDPPIAVPSDSEWVVVNVTGTVLSKAMGSEELITIGDLSCFRFHAGNLPEASLDKPTDPLIPPMEGTFGKQSGCFVLSGWAVDR